MVAASIVGNAPVAFTDSTGAQRSVPLSAFMWDAAGTPPLSLAPHWTVAGSTFVISPADLNVIQNLIAIRMATREYTLSPQSSKVLALGFQAVAAGPDGNDIAVSLNEPSPAN